MIKLEPKAVEKKLKEFIKKHNRQNVLTAARVKEWIFNDYGDSPIDASNRFNKKFFEGFSSSLNENDFGEMLEIATNCWNVFPHKSLKGKSPQELFEEELKKNPELTPRGREKMPDVIVGGKEMSWREHQDMLREMEKTQKPFKDFVEKEIIPAYKKMIDKRTDLAGEIKRRQILVAETFFERVFWVGFIDYRLIRPDFAKYEFPRWWQAHVLSGENLDENQVWLALRHLINFIRENYGLEMSGPENRQNPV